MELTQNNLQALDNRIRIYRFHMYSFLKLFNSLSNSMYSLQNLYL